MKKLIAAMAILALAAVAATPAHALRRFGDASKEFRYNRLEIARTSGNDCIIRGQLINQTRESFRNVYVTITAFDRDRQIIWDTIFRVSFGPEQTIDFSERILDCNRETNPFKLQWEFQK
jgi:hypothetical protein